MTLDDGGVPRKQRRRGIGMAIFLLLVVGVPALASSGTISSEWALALGHSREVTAAVIGERSNVDSGRTCDYDAILVGWTDHGRVRAGSFEVCSDDRHDYPTGRRVRVAVQPGNSHVVEGEGRGGAIAGAIIEALFGLFMAAMIGWLLRGAVLWSRAPGRLADSRPVTLETAARTRGGLNKFVAAVGPDRLRIVVQKRSDGYRLHDGDRVELFATRPRLRGPYGLRDADGRLFWALGKPIKRG